MNILPKKRWHVRTKDNIARVRRDEAQAALDEEARLKRAALAEQEARTSLLRSRVVANSDPVAQVDSKEEHVNFFADIEHQERTFGINKEHELEKQNDKEAYEKRIGLLKYLGEGSSEYNKEVPWYLKAPQRPDPAKERMIIGQISTVSTNQVAKNMLKRLLPRNSDKIEESHSKRHRKRHRNDSSSSDSSSEDITLTKKTNNSKLDQMRQERLRREQAEKLRSEELLRRVKKTEKSDRNDQVPANKPYQQKYSSQFNPQLARQNL